MRQLLYNNIKNKNTTTIVYSKLIYKISKRFFPGNLGSTKQLLKRFWVVNDFLPWQKTRIIDNHFLVSFNFRLNSIINKYKNTFDPYYVTSYHYHTNPINILYSQRPLCLPLNFLKKNIISGLITLSPKDYDLLMTNNPLSLEYRSVFNSIIHCVFHHLFAKPLNTTNILEIIKKIFKSVGCIEMSKQLYPKLEHRIISLTQHVLVYTCGNKTFSYEFLKQVCVLSSNIHFDHTSYENQTITILTFIELFIISEFASLLDNLSHKSLVYSIINPESFGNMSVQFNDVISKDQTGQRNADLMIRELGTLYKIYYDVKSYPTLGFNFRRISVIHDDIKKCNKYINDIFVSLQQIIRENNVKKDTPISDLYYKLKSKKQGKSSREVYLSLLEEIIPCTLKPEYQLLKPSIVLILDKDKEFQQYYETFLKMQEKLKETSCDEFTKGWFPNDCVIENDVHERIITNSIKEFFRENSKEILDNFKLLRDGIL